MYIPCLFEGRLIVWFVENYITDGGCLTCWPFFWGIYRSVIDVKSTMERRLTILQGVMCRVLFVVVSFDV